jgi:hypothetical protein
MSNLLIGFIIGAAAGGFFGYGTAMIVVKFDRARRGWKRKV